MKFCPVRKNVSYRAHLSRLPVRKGWRGQFGQLVSWSVGLSVKSALPNRAAASGHFMCFESMLRKQCHHCDGEAVLRGAGWIFIFGADE